MRLSDTEVWDLLHRHPEVASKVSAHEAYVQDFGWDQTELTKGGIWGKPTTVILPIPVDGLTFKDDVYGNVVIFPDAQGVLRYDGNVEQVPASIGEPFFQSPTGNTLEQYIQDLKNAFGDLWGDVVLLAFGLGVVWIVVNKR